MTDPHTPAKGDQYRNREVVPGYGLGLLVIQVIDVEQDQVDYLVIESNRMRTGPFVGITGSYSKEYLYSNFEYMPEIEADVLEPTG